MKTLIVFLAPSGYGKSTCAKYIQNKYNGEIIKLATPLYEMQKYFYEKINMKINSQDGELLQFLGNKVQKTNPEFLFKEFLKSYNKSESSLIINDDCRPHNFNYLKNLGAVFIGIKGPSRIRPEDTSPHDLTNSLEWKDNIPCDYIINNEGNLESLYIQLDSLLKEISCG